MANSEEGAKKELHQKFSVVSYNVQFLPKFLHSYNYSKTRVNKIAELVKNDDIILLQEAFMNKKKMSKQAQQPWSWSPVFKKSSLLRRLHETFHSPGLMALSKTPIHKVLAKSYDINSGIAGLDGDWLCKKGFQIFKRGDIHIVNTHLDAGKRSKDIKARRKQIEILLSHLPEGPLILAGDFNLRRGIKEDRDTLKLLFNKSGLRLAKMNDVDLIAYRGEGIIKKIDSTHEDNQLSDHAAIRVEFEIKDALL